MGVWKLQYFVHTNLNVCDTSLPFGKEPYGFITFTQDGSFSNTALSPCDEVKLIAESGTYKKLAKNRVEIRFRSALGQFEDEKVVVRHYQIDEETLIIASCIQDENTQDEILETMVWKRWKTSPTTITKRH